jgi:hypothetical protein
MESEVNALMGATDEEHWERVGLFASVDELCRSNDKRHLHNGGINDPFTPSVEFPFPLTPALNLFIFQEE